MQIIKMGKTLILKAETSQEATAVDVIAEQYQSGKPAEIDVKKEIFTVKQKDV